MGILLDSTVPELVWEDLKTNDRMQEFQQFAARSHAHQDLSLWLLSV